jgi:hypothetical protein
MTCAEARMKGMFLCFSLPQSPVQICGSPIRVNPRRSAVSFLPLLVSGMGS